MSDNVVVFISLVADIKCEAVSTATTWTNQKQAIYCSMPIQQYLSLLL